MRACVEIDIQMMDVCSDVFTTMSSITSSVINVLCIIIDMIVYQYINVIGNKNNYVVLTVISECLSPMRGIVPLYIAKVIIDMHREYMRMSM